MAQILSITEFRQGYRGEIDPVLLPVGAASAISNLVLDRGTLAVRAGVKKRYPITLPTGGVKGPIQLAEYHNAAWAVATRTVAQVTVDPGSGEVGNLLISGSDFSSPTVITTGVPKTPVRFAQFGTALYCTSATYIKRLLYDESHPEYYTDVLPTVTAPTVAPAYLTNGAGFLPAGSYDVMYTFAQGMRDGAFRESQPSPITTATLGADDEGMEFSVVTTGGSGAYGTDKIYVYLRQSGTTDWFRALELEWGNQAAYLNRMDTTQAVYAQYAYGPPSGCVNLYSHGGRMWYVKGDLLYYSNYTCPEYVPLDYTAEDAPARGGFLRIGDDGGNITGLQTFGSYLVIFKARGIWRVVGDPGDPAFVVEPLARERGALCQEGIAGNGNLLAWTERGGVWAWDGGQFFEIGRAIRADWQAALLADSTRTGASLAYDPDKRHLVLAIPPSSWGATLTANWFVADLNEPIGADAVDGRPQFGWTMWAGMPGGVVQYLPSQAYPGLYATDAGKSTLASGLYQANVGSTDDCHNATGAAIAWSWKSGLLTFPDPRLWKAITRIDVARSGSLGATALTLALIDDRNTQWTKTITPASPTYRATWWPAPTRDLQGFYLKVSGSTSTGEELLAVLAEVQARGKARV